MKNISAKRYNIVVRYLTRNLDMPVHIVLVCPEIPANTGNIIRLAANVGAHLHLAEPLGFQLDDKRLRRAGLDYHSLANMRTHADTDAALNACGDGRRFAVTTQGACRYDAIRYRSNDVLIFGRESTGLPQALCDAIPHPQHLFIPMLPGNRSMNLSNAVAVVMMEAWRQMAFNGAARAC